MTAGAVRAKLERLGDYALFAFALALPLSISVSQAALGLLILVRVVLWVSGARPRLVANPWPAVFLTLYVAAAALSAVLSPVDSSASLRKLQGFWILSAFFVAYEQVKSRAQLKRILELLLVASAVAGAYGIYQHLTCSHPLAMGIEGRVRELAGYCQAIGFFDHHLTYATQMMMAALIGAGISLAAGWRARIIYVLLSALVVSGLVFSYARGPWLGFVAALAIFFWSWKRRAAIVFAAVAIIAAVGLAMFVPSIAARAKAAFSSSANADRIALWNTTVEMIKDHPWLGVGTGMYRRAIPPYREGYNVRFLSSAHAHHNILQELAERGIIGTVFLVAFWFTIFYVGAKKIVGIGGGEETIYLGMQAALFSLWVAGMFQYNLGDAENAMLAYLICGLIAGGDGDDG